MGSPEPPRNTDLEYRTPAERKIEEHRRSVPPDSTRPDARDLVRWLRGWTVREGVERGTRRRIERFHRWADSVEATEERVNQLEQETKLLRAQRDAYIGRVSQLEQELSEAERSLDWYVADDSSG